MGMDLNPALARQIVSDLVAHATSIGAFIRIDMEGTHYTQATLDLVRELHVGPNRGHVGAVLQAYLYRSADDVDELLREGIPIRLCKGAYDEPPSREFRMKADVDSAFIRLMKALLTSGICHGIATHDERMIEATRRFAQERNIHDFEFQMLFGIRRDLQRTLAQAGYRVRVYVPFGKEWYPYFMRRLAERPANLLFLATNLLRN
jgi:proline dehydrogenase